MLFGIPDLGQPELAVAEVIAELRKALRHAVGTTPKRWQGLLRRSALARAVSASNSIEGYDVSVDDAIAAAEGEQPLDARAEAWQAVRGYQAAMTYVLQLADDSHFRYSADLFRSLHFMMLQYDLTKHPGTWRPGAVYVRDEERRETVYEGPEAILVPTLMDELATSLESADKNTPAIVLAAMAHLNLVMVHPFSDGNGRMARCLQTLVLARSGTLAPQFSSIEEYLGRFTRPYYDVLSQVGKGSWHPEHDAKPWVRFCLTAHFQQATTLLRRTREMERLWTALEEETEVRKMPPRIILALVDAALGYRIRNATYRPVADVTEQVAARDLRLAVSTGFLEAKGESRARHYVAAPLLQAIRQATRETKKVVDPFAIDSEQMSLLPGV